MNWNNILTFFISVGAITGAIVYIGKRIVDKSLDLALEKYKSTLAIELETHKKQLDKVLFEHQVKFGKLHQDRLEAIKAIHSELYNLYKVLPSVRNKEQAEEWLRNEEKSELIGNILNDLEELSEINQIYFNENLFIRIMEILKESTLIYTNLLNLRIDDLKIQKRLILKEDLSEEERSLDFG